MNPKPQSTADSQRVPRKVHDAAVAYANWRQSEWRAALEGNQDAWNRIVERVDQRRTARIINMDKL